MIDLDGRRVFLSASVPEWDRRTESGEYSPSEITDAVTAVARATLEANGRLVFGGHPSITRLLLWTAREVGHGRAIDLFQSEWFRAEIPPETWELAEGGYAELHWTPAMESQASSLRLMRENMLRVDGLAAAVFIGGMAGIREEFDLTAQISPQVLRIPLGGPGGAAVLLLDDSELPGELSDVIQSRRYGYLAAMIVETIAGPRPQSDG